MTNTIDNAVQGGEKPQLPQVGEIVNRYDCGICGIVTSMTYDGRAMHEEDIARNPIFEKYRNMGSYTCQNCKGTFSIQDQ